MDRIREWFEVAGLAWVRSESKIYRLAAIALSFVFFATFPALVLCSYMSWQGFFSFDMFRDGASGTHAFYWWTEIAVVWASMWIAGSLAMFTRVLTGTERLSRRDAALGVILNAAVTGSGIWFIRTYKVGNPENIELLLFWLTSAWISVHVAMLTNGSGRQILRSLLVGIFGLTTISVAFPGTYAIPYSLVLQLFGNGGGLPVSAKLLRSSTEIQGSLLLASPDHIYVYSDQQRNLIIVRRSEIESLRIKNRLGFGHTRNPFGAPSP